MILPDDPNRPGSETDPRRGRDGPDDGMPGITWAPFDPGDAPELPASTDGSGRVIAMIASIELVGVGWAVSVASELARVWAEERPGVVLVDTDLARPRLHHAVRVDNAVGLAEVLRGEAPVAEATRTVHEDRLFCVPAGNAPEDPSEGFDAGRWRRLCKAFSDAGVTVVAYVPVRAGWIDTVLETATDVVLLAEQNRRLEWPREGAPPLRAVLGPMPLTRAPSDPTGKGRTGASPLLGFDAPAGADAPEHEPPARRSEPAPSAAVGHDASVRPTRTAGGGRRTTATRHRPGPWLALGGVLLVAAGAVWALSRPMAGPAAGPDEGTSPVSRPPSGGGAAGAPARVVPPEAEFSIAVASYTDRASADARAARLSLAVTGVPWMVAPVELNGTVYHRVLAGLVADSAAAAALGAELAREGRGGITDWVVRASGWVVDLGTQPTRAAADQTLERVRVAGFPAYVARIRLTDGTERFGVHAGAYAGPEEAATLVEQVRAAGFEARPARRTGRPVS